MLSGGHLTDDLFDQARFDFDALMPWARPPGIAADGDAPNTVQADATSTALIETVTGTGTTVRLLTGATGSWDDSRVHLDQWCQFETTGDPRSIHDVLNGWVRPRGPVDCVPRPPGPAHVTVRPTIGVGPRDERVAVSFAAVQPASRTPPTQSEIDKYNAPTLVTRPSSPIPVEVMVAAWYDTCERLRDAVTLLCVPYHAPFIYSEHRYASTFQAAEALAHELFRTTDRTPTDHKLRVGAVTAALTSAGLNEDVVKWATAILQSRNDKSLAVLIEELTRGTGGIGDRILEAVLTFPRDVARAQSASPTAAPQERMRCGATGFARPCR